MAGRGNILAGAAGRRGLGGGDRREEQASSQQRGCQRYSNLFNESGGWNVHGEVSPSLTGPSRRRGLQVRSRQVLALRYERGPRNVSRSMPFRDVRVPPPGCFRKRGCKRLKTKETRAEKSPKRR